MIVKQVKDFVNLISKEAYGESAVVVTDQTGLVSLGDTVLSSDKSTDTFLRTLVDRIYYTIEGGRSYTSQFGDFVMHTSDYGCVLQKIRVKPMKAVESVQYDLAAGDSVDQYVITKPDVMQKLFQGRNVWEIDITIPEQGLQDAFLSFETMGAFIDAIFTAISNSMEQQIESSARAAVANFMGEKLWQSVQPTNNGKLQVIHTLQAYNTAQGKTLTAAQALTDGEYLKWSSRLINLYISRLRYQSALFNSEDMVNFTPSDYVRVLMLADYTTAAQYYLQSDTFHNDLTSLPHYTEVPYWQGSGLDYSFENTSTIDLVTSSGNSVKQDGIICLLTDVEAIGMMCNRRRLRTSPPNAKGEYINYFQKAEIRYYNDLSENGIVFTLTDTPFTLPSSSARVAKK